MLSSIYQLFRSVNHFAFYVYLDSTFLLVSFACVGGCLFNRYKRHMYGWDCIPFIDTYRGWYDRCCHKDQSASYQVHGSDVGPQAQFDAQIHEPVAYAAAPARPAASTGAYGSYQSM